MGTSLEDFYTFLPAAWRRRATASGIFRLFVALNVICLPGFLVLFSSVGWPTPGESRAIALVVALSVVNLIFAGCVLWWRRIPVFSPEESVVLFAPHTSQGNEVLVDALYKRFRRDLASRGLTNIRPYSLLHRDNLTLNREEATAILEQSRARVIVYGSYESGNRNAEQVGGFTSITFLFRSGLQRAIAVRPLLEHALANASRRSFVVRDGHSFVDRQVVVENLTEVACFLTAMTLIIDGRLERAQPILEHLLETLDTKDPLEFVNFREGIVGLLTICLEGEFAEVYTQECVSDIGDPAINEAIERLDALTDRLIALNGPFGGFTLRKAIFAFHRGDVAEAGRLVTKAQKEDGRLAAAPNLSRAFLALWEGDYEEALRAYRAVNIRREELSTATIMGVVAFLDGIVEHFPEKPEIRFGLAIVNEILLDRQVAIEEYANFLREVGDSDEYTVLRRYSKNRLKKLPQ